jgi:hypothetical protein
MGAAAASLLVTALLLASCSSSGSPTPRPSVAPSGSGVAVVTPAPSASPTPTPRPTPHYTNAPDADLAALIPTSVGGFTVTIPPPSDFAYTPGDIGEAYGDVGLRFRALQVAFIPRPNSLSLYAMRMDPPFVTTEELEPYLGTAGQYVGISQQDREPWELVTVGGRVTWVRPEDNATALGTMVYTWAAEEYVFLLIGVDDALNQAMFAALPGEAAPTPTPRPSRSPSASGSDAASSSAEPSTTASGS